MNDLKQKIRAEGFGPVVKGAKCVRCGAPVAWMFERLVGSDVCLCAKCTPPKAAADDGTDRQAVADRLRRAGLAKEKAILRALGITPKTLDGKLEAKERRLVVAVTTVRRYLETQAVRRTLVLTGPPQIGKSTAAAFAAWTTRGVYLTRAAWSDLPVRYKGRDPDDAALATYRTLGGVVVLDDVMTVNRNGGAGDSEGQVEAVFQITTARHAAELPTILTTQATEAEIVSAYGSRGEAILERARAGRNLAGDPEGGGVVVCTVPTAKG